MEASPKIKLDEFLCPISQEIMEDPVIGPDGHTYERQAIVSWLRIHNTSPITRAPMNASQLIPNIALRNAIEESLGGKPKAVFMAEVVAKPLPKLESDDIDISLQIMEQEDGKGLLHISVIPSKEGKRKPCAVVCMVDTSGSMINSSLAEQENEGGFCILDLIKHSVTTIANVLGPDDYLSVISFSDSAKVILELTPMNETGKKIASRAVDSLMPENTTNIWDALRVAINMASESPICKTLNTSFWLFTDGKPNFNPPRGIVATLEMFLEERFNNFVLNTFGFGYDLDSRLLHDISALQNGIFCYIPDGNLVGTTFINCLCNTLSAATNRGVLEIIPEKGDSLECVGYTMKDKKIEVGTIQYGQTRDFVIKFQCPKFNSPKFTVKLKYQDQEVVRKISGVEVKDPVEIFRTLARGTYVEMIKDALDTRRTVGHTTDFLEKLKGYISSLPAKDDNVIKALLRDLTPKGDEGRVSKAFSTKERIDRWGKHYTRSILRAHQLQQCHNFKDPGVQFYGGKLFRQLQYKADMTFCNLPPPIATIKRMKEAEAKAEAEAAAQAAAQAMSSMNDYLDCSGGCFDGEGLVLLADGSMKKVRNLHKGDKVISSTGEIAEVICLVEFPVKRSIEIVRLNNLYLTPKHPVMDRGTWVYPKDIGTTENCYCDSIYNLALDQSHVVSINGIDVVTLGHGKYDNEKVKHEYYGSERIIRDLSYISGWEDGFVVMKNCKKWRDPFTGKIVRIVTQE